MGDALTRGPMESWPPEMIEQLREWWDAGHSAAVITQKFAEIWPERLLTRNMVIGKAHRLRLARRPSPIKHKRKPAADVIAKGHTCMWPIGDPKEKDFRFCGAGALPDKPYCAEHTSRARHRGETPEALEA